MLHTFSADARYVRALTTSGRAQLLLGPRPFEADLAASHYCAPWYMTAPPLAQTGPVGHQAGPWPNVAMLRLLLTHIDSVGNPAAALVLARALHALWPDADDAIALLTGIEAALGDRGAVTPPWSLQLDQWRFVSAHGFDIDEDDGAQPRPSYLVGFEHPCGDRHGILVSLDRATGAVDSCHVQPSFDEILPKLDEQLRHNGAEHGLVECEAHVLGTLLDAALQRSLEQEYQPIRFDEESASTFSLLASRARLLATALVPD